MKQILQNLKSGTIEVADIPRPGDRDGHISIRTSRTLVSAGTERMLMEFGRAGWIQRARQQPDKVLQVLGKIRTEGLVPTVGALRAALDQSIPLGYCNVGTITEIPDSKFEIQSLKVGGRVASNGYHADYVCVPKNLCAGVPDNVTDDEAVFTVVGAIGLQGVRLAGPTLGECFVVTGLGLIGLLTVQILRANGCRVLGIDVDSGKCEMARMFGAEAVDISKGEDPVAAALSFSRGLGVDGVLITAATKSSEPVHQAASMCRKRGRIVLVGVTGLDLSRNDFYQKEISFQVSCSYGPGRYDSDYEEKGHDYPVGYVRWTEQRNFEAVLDLMSTGKLDVKPLITHRFPIEHAEKAYEMIAGGRESYLGILLEYRRSEDGRRRPDRKTVMLAAEGEAKNLATGKAVVSFIGAGNYAGRVLIPAFKEAGAGLLCLVSRGGVGAVHFGKKFGFEEVSTNVDGVFKNENVNIVVIATRHDTHAGFVIKALKAGKHVFVEKPLCLTIEELREIQEVYSDICSLSSDHRQLMVGFNRRFAPQIKKIKSLLDMVREPKSFIMTMNPGTVPANHWIQDRETGGGRIIGEACHYIDLMRYLAGSEIISIHARRMGDVPGMDVTGDKAAIILGFADGSFGAIHYLANGHKSFPKERIEVFASGRVLQLDDFTRLKGYGWPGFEKMNLWRQDKGQKACVAAFLNTVINGLSQPIPAVEIFEVARVSIEVDEILKKQ